MRCYRSLMEPGGVALGRHLQRLSNTLKHLGNRLRDAVSAAIGHSVADVVRETVRSLLIDKQTEEAQSKPLMQPAGHQENMMWHDRDDPPQPDDLWMDEARQSSNGQADEQVESVCRSTNDPQHGRCWNAFTVGCHTAFWALRQRTAQHPILRAIGLALMASMAAWACSPLLCAGLSLMVLANTMHLSAQLLTGAL